MLMLVFVEQIQWLPRNVCVTNGIRYSRNGY